MLTPFGKHFIKENAKDSFPNVINESFVIFLQNIRIARCEIDNIIRL